MLNSQQFSIIKYYLITYTIKDVENKPVRYFQTNLLNIKHFMEYKKGKLAYDLIRDNI